jgi:ribonuclease BN (tRNA processing enzyme)
MHGDHFGGVPFLFMEYLYERPRQRPLVVYGPPETEARVSRLFTALYEKSSECARPFPLRYEVVCPGVPHDVAGVRAVAFQAPHVPELCCYGYRLEVAGRTIVYSGDSAWTEEFVTQTRGADLFICECSSYETHIDIHVSYPEIAARARDLGAKRLVLSHLGAEVLRHLPELSLECARDGMTIEL